MKIKEACGARANASKARNHRVISSVIASGCDHPGGRRVQILTALVILPRDHVEARVDCCGVGERDPGGGVAGHPIRTKRCDGVVLASVAVPRREDDGDM